MRKLDKAFFDCCFGLAAGIGKQQGTLEDRAGWLSGRSMKGRWLLGFFGFLSRGYGDVLRHASLSVPSTELATACTGCQTAWGPGCGQADSAAKLSLQNEKIGEAELRNRLGPSKA